MSFPLEVDLLSIGKTIYKTDWKGNQQVLNIIIHRVQNLQSILNNCKSHCPPNKYSIIIIMHNNNFPLFIKMQNQRLQKVQ